MTARCFEELRERTGSGDAKLSDMLRRLTEDGIVEYSHQTTGRFAGTRGIAAYMILAIHYLLAGRVFSVSEYLPH